MIMRADATFRGGFPVSACFNENTGTTKVRESGDTRYLRVIADLNVIVYSAKT